MTTIEKEGNIFKMTAVRPAKSIYPFIMSAMLLGAFNFIVYELFSNPWKSHIFPILFFIFLFIFLFGGAVIALIAGILEIIPRSYILDEHGLWTKCLRNISLLCTWEEITNVSYDSYHQRYRRHRNYRFSPRIEIKTSRRLKKDLTYERSPGEPRSPTWERRNFYHVLIGEGALDHSDLRILYNEIRSHWMNRGIRDLIPDTRPASHQIKRAEAV